MYCYTKKGLERVSGRLLFLGDSIADGGHYISFINAYLRLTNNKDVTIINAGVSSETASGLSEPDHPFPRPCVHGRIDRALELTKPNWVIVCYGINDGIYYPYSKERADAYLNGIISLVNKIQAYGAKAVVMTPTPFDPFLIADRLLDENQSNFSYMQPYKDYDNVMKKYSEDIMCKISEYADAVIDLRTPLYNDIMQNRRSDPMYSSGDSIHPNLHGHFVIARTILTNLFRVSTMKLELMLQNDEMKLFNLIYRYDNLKHSYYKESIGHDNPNKNNVPDDYEAQLKKLDREITQYIHDNPELTTIHSEWHGFETVEFFTSEGYEAILVKPDIAAPGTPWAWRTEFFGAFPSVDIELIKNGWHIVHVRLPDLYGCDIAVDAMDKFYLHIVERFKLKPKTVLFGFSRGGLYSVNYAARFPERVESLYLDAPVVDIRSWPKGEYSGTGAPYEWNQCTLAYGVNHNEEERINNVLGVLLEYRIPLVLVAGDSDQIVPYNENGKFLEDAYIKTNIPFKLIMKKGVGHHPHSLDNPEEIVNFLTFHSKESPAS